MNTIKQIDFLAVGDIVVDAFIKLQGAHVHSGIDTDGAELCVTFGDKIPYESVDVVNGVGNGPNAAVSASRLGLVSASMTNIGDDATGKDCLDALEQDKVITEYVSMEAGKKTNYHYVLWFGVERTILVKHTEFTYSFSDKFKDGTEISWIYLTSLGENSLPYHMEIAEYLKAHPETKLAFQPGTFQIKLGTEQLKDIYAHTEVFFCNVEEAEKILGIQSKDIKVLSKGLHDLGPKIVAISDGPKGAFASDGENIWSVPIYPDTAPATDRTGAGDAFASTFTAALGLGMSVPEALAWGPINSMSVVQQIGAQKGLLPREKLEELLKNAPESYKVKKLD
ncbi:MAG: carbohydrate kinase family protein [bacterium]|nr:carbohydrate kinase family protein [bacterium]